MRPNIQARSAFTHLRSKELRRGFTLIELLVVLGILGILAGIVITAIAPSRQLAAANDAWRRSSQREISNAITQYVIDTGALPVGIPTGSSNALPICRESMAGEAGCVNLDVLVTDDYITALPVDTVESSGALIGFNIYQESGGFVTVNPVHLGESGTGGGTTGGTTGGSTGGDGCTPGGDPIVICDCDDLQNMDTDLTADYELGANITCSGNFTPIGSEATPFTGSLEGGGYSISGISMSLSSGEIGIFGRISSPASLTNFTVLAPSISGTAIDMDVGGIVGYNDDGTLSKVSVIGGTISVTGGEMYESPSVVGGLVGRNYGTISNSFVQSTTITATNDHVTAGGISADCGNGAYNGISAISDSYVDATVSAADGVNVGGICGAIGTSYSGAASLTNVFFSGTVSGAGNVGTGIGTYSFNYNGPMTNVHVLDAPCVAYSLHGVTGQDCTVQAGESHFYDNANAPLSAWDFSTVWQEEVSALPTLR